MNPKSGQSSSASTGKKTPEPQSEPQSRWDEEQAFVTERHAEAASSAKRADWQTRAANAHLSP